MKRMNLIRVALFAVFAFMGTYSLSAQTWMPPAQAIVVLNNELDLLSEPPAPTPTNGLTSKQDLNQRYAMSGFNCTDCQIHAVKVAFIQMTLLRIKSGMDTGPAVEEVRTVMIGGSGNNQTVLNSIQTVYAYMDSIL